MKGGITSGIVYPPAICEIARKFHFVGVGGTSAGAIAAGIAAAAEYRRRNGDPSGFDRVAAISDTLAAPGNLLHLFRPDAETEDLFDIAMDAMRWGESGLFSKAWLVLRGLGLYLKHGVTLPLVGNGFGLSSGMANDNPPPRGRIAPLTRWLADEIDSVAGNIGPDPLTFGDLMGAPIPEKFANTMSGHEHRSIDLRFVTTCLTFGRPYQLPFDERIFAFDPVEFRRLFPERVCDYIEREAEKIKSNTLRKDGKLPFPTGAKMPVIVAVRMSLSFPALFSAVPLYAIDYHTHGNPMKKLFFSDGGITSNFPIHYFDSLFPRWPTLAITLQQTGEDGKPRRASADDTLVHMTKRASDGALEMWNDGPSTGRSLSRAVAFAGTIFASAQNWHDNNYAKLPGFRERVVEIWQKPEEGGLNLEMPPEVIKRLTERGRWAGEQLVARFADASPEEALSWEGHRWARFRSGMEGLTRYLHQLKATADHPMPGDRTLQELLAAVDAPPDWKRFDEAQLAQAREAVEKLLAYLGDLEQMDSCGDPWDAPGRPFCDGPRPSVEIGSRAPM